MVCKAEKGNRKGSRVRGKQFRDADVEAGQPLGDLYLCQVFCAEPTTQLGFKGVWQGLIF